MPVDNEISSRELMEEIVARAVLEAVQSIREANKGNDNLILREIKALHSNTTKGDMPEHLQKLIPQIAQSMFGFIGGHGYVLVPKDMKRK